MCIIILGIAVYFIFYIFSTPTLKSICAPDLFYRNINNYSNQDFEILAIAKKVNIQLQWNMQNKVLSLEELRKERNGDCDEYSLLLDACLKLYNYNSTIESKEWENNAHHTYVRVNNRTLDATLSEPHMTLLYLNNSIYFDYFQGEFLKEYFKQEGWLNK